MPAQVGLAGWRSWCRFDVRGLGWIYFFCPVPVGDDWSCPGRRDCSAHQSQVDGSLLKGSALRSQTRIEDFSEHAVTARDFSTNATDEAPPPRPRNLSL